MLAVSVGARLAWTYLAPNGDNFVDLHVYVGSGTALGAGELNDFVYAEQTPDFALPFIYPPFAAVLAYPLNLVSFGVLGLAWLLTTIAGVYALVRLSQRLLGTAAGAGRGTAMAWTAIGIWLEPVRSTLDYGQVNVFLAVAVLYAVYSARWQVSGLLVGLAAGVKLTPAVSGLYFVGVRRWATAVFAAAVFLATVALSVLVAGGEQVRYYFTRVLLEDSARELPISTVFNQSWRGAISRILGHDAGRGPLVLAAIALTAVLAVLAWRAIGAADRLGGILVVTLFGLLASPISWTHHWVWVLPLVIWLIHGPQKQRPGANLLGWGWLALTLIGVPWLLSFAQPDIWQYSRPWYLAWAGLSYPAATVVTLAWMATTGRSRAAAEPVLSA